MKHDKQKNRYDYLYQTIDEIKPSRIMEIGAFNGTQAEKMIIRAKLYHSQVEYYGFDLFVQAPDFEFSKLGVRSLDNVLGRLKRTGAKIVLVEGNTKDTLPSFESDPMDMIFIDGGHSIATVQNDFVNSARLLAKDGRILLDDYYPDHPEMGCKTLVDSVSGCRVLEHTDSFKKPFGVLRVKMAEFKFGESSSE